MASHDKQEASATGIHVVKNDENCTAGRRQILHEKAYPCCLLIAEEVVIISVV